MAKGEALVSLLNKPDICCNTGGSLFERDVSDVDSWCSPGRIREPPVSLPASSPLPLGQSVEPAPRPPGRRATAPAEPQCPN